MMKIKCFTGIFCCICPLAFNPGFIQAAQETTRVSVKFGTENGEPDDISPSSSISYSGRYVAFTSYATNLVSPPDPGTNSDIFFWDRINRTTERISISASGGEPDNGSWSPSISGDGLYVAFQSSAKDLLDPPDNQTYSDVFVRNRIGKTTERVSASASGGEPDNGSWSPSISGDGLYVAFQSSATDLLDPPDSQSIADIFVRDRQLNTTERVSVKYNTESDEPNGTSYQPSISGDGRYVAFVSSATDLLQSTDTTSQSDIFVRDRITKTTERVSVKYNTVSDEPNGTSSSPSISSNGRYVAFSSEATDLVETDTNGVLKDIFVFDRQTRTTELISVNSAGEPQTCSGNEWNDGGYAGALSADGRYVAFISNCPNLVDNDTNDSHDLFRRDRQNKKTIRASVNTAGEEQDGAVWVEYDSFAISGNGQFMTFRSSATNLVEPNDQLAYDDIFMREEEKEFFWPLFLPQKSKD